MVVFSIYYALGSKLHQIAVPETDATLISITSDGEICLVFHPDGRIIRYSSAHKMKIEAEASEEGAQVKISSLLFLFRLRSSK